jgi:outer membrane protein assembly factor BamB
LELVSSGIIPKFPGEVNFMAERKNLLRSFGILLAVLLIPFVGLILLWRSPRRVWLKLLGTIGFFLHGLVYAGLIVFLLLRYGGAQVEWRGGYIPVLTWHKTKTDLAALERNRAQQAKLTPKESPHETTPPYWTGFRGPHRDGHYDEQPISTNWPASGLKLLWKQPCGGGYSSFAIAEGQAFTLEQRGENEVAVAYDFETGRELWTNGWPARFTEMHSDDGPRTTPEYSEGKIYVLGATGEFRCLNSTNGEIVWGTNVCKLNQTSTPAYGHAATPLVVDEKLIVLTYTSGRGEIFCFHKLDGRIIWRSPTGTLGYVSPSLAVFDGERQVIFGGRPDVFALRLEDGRRRWSAAWPILNNERPIAQPVLIGTNRILFSAAYLTGATLFEVNRTDDAFAAKEIWKTRRLKNKFAASVYFDGNIYGLDEDILTCIDAGTGETKWKDGRYGYGQVLLASGHLIVLCGNGDLALVKATPERHIELARFSGIQGKTWNYPAIANGKILIRNLAEMACFDISPE